MNGVLKLDLQEIVNKFSQIDKVKQVYLLGKDGNVIVHLIKPAITVDNILVLAKQIILFGGKLISILKKKDFFQTYLEFESFNMTCEVLSGNFFLVIVSENGVNLGRIRLEIRHYKTALEDILNKG